MRKKDIEIGGEYLASSNDGKSHARVRVLSRDAFRDRKGPWSRGFEEDKAAHTVEILEVWSSGYIGIPVRAADPERAFPARAEVGAVVYMRNRSLIEPWSDDVRARINDAEAAKAEAKEEAARVTALAAELKPRAKAVGAHVESFRGLKLTIKNEADVVRVLEFLESVAS